MIPDKKQIKRIVFEIPERKHREIKLAATALGLTIKAFLDLSIKEKIENEKKNFPKNL